MLSPEMKVQWQTDLNEILPTRIEIILRKWRSQLAGNTRLWHRIMMMTIRRMTDP